MFIVRGQQLVAPQTTLEKRSIQQHRLRVPLVPVRSAIAVSTDQEKLDAEQNQGQRGKGQRGPETS